MLELIRTIDPEFGMDPKKKQFMTQTDATIQQLGKTSRLKMKRTLAKVVKAAISALSKCPEDHPNIWNFFKQSGYVETELGISALTDVYIKQIINANNRATNEVVRDQMLSLVAKLGYRRLRKFNPPKRKKIAKKKATPPINRDDNDKTTKSTEAIICDQGHKVV